MKAIAEYIVKIKVIEDCTDELANNILSLPKEDIDSIRGVIEADIKDAVVDHMKANAEVSVNTIRFEFLEEM
jgi:hypothetical protein